MIYREEKRDLFKVDSKYDLAHCISLDCAMGAGIAKEFVNQFPSIRNEVNNTIIENNLNYPITIPHFENCDYEGNDRIVFNLITKEKYWHKPTYKTIKTCIKEMADMCDTYSIEYLAMPKIACGLDRLSWEKVREIIKEEFKDLDIEILVCYM